MSAGRDPVDRVIDLMVAAPLSAAVATRRALPIFARAGRRRIAVIAERTGIVTREPVPVVRPSSTEHDADGSIGESVTTGDSTTGRTTVADTDGTADAETALPIDGYDHLAARQVCDRLGALTPDELDAVAAYERAHRGRRTVLGKIEQLTS